MAAFEECRGRWGQNIIVIIDSLSMFINCMAKYSSPASQSLQIAIRIKSICLYIFIFAAPD